ncbi:MAG: hypothetical protein HKP48_05090 [Winogradskyella sp.]|uniref:hypothetical protein n=1 Tax=Winogradskyella sp. TaxID=1883156 RepID=UPI0017F57932|nr:hypothetical protein [Winogradskyella sp.]MBT8244598.1 hypothetical protein [Winogradskyella sp.]NNK22674.1 hypothetical protein [Winogradskyella sp.]
MIEKEFTIREPKSSILDIVAVSAALTIQTGFCYYIFTNVRLNFYAFFLIALTGYILFNSIIIPGLRTKCIYLNFSKRKIKYEIEIGPLTIRKKWKDIENPEYVSVFKTPKGIEVNLWHNKNQIINLFAYDDFEKVIEEAFFFADKLNIDLLDARERGYHKWIDKNFYQQHKKVRYIE